MIAFHRADLDDVGPVGDFQIWVKNVAGGQPLQLTFDEASAASPCWSPKGDQIVFNHRGGIWSVSPLGGTPRLVIEHGLMPRFSVDGNRIVFEHVSPGGGIWIANADGSHRRRIVEMRRLGAPASPALSPDGGSVAFFQSEGGSTGDIWVAPTEGGTPRRLTFDSSDGGGPVWTPDGRFIFYYSSRGGSQTLWRIPADGGTPEPVTSGAGQDRDPDISRDGTRLVYSNFRVTHALVVVDPATGQQRELLQRRLMIRMPRFSSDGHRVAFSQQMDTGAQIFTINVDGNDLRQVTEGPGQDNLAPHWSNDDAWLYFFQPRPTRSLRKVSVLGGGPTDLRSWSDAEAAEIDPSGRAVVYVRLKDGKPSETVVQSLSTGYETPLDMLLNSPRWSPDAQTIVGWQPAPEAGSSQVVSCAVPRGACRVLERGFNPVVTPDGSRIFFVRQSATTSGRRELWSIRPDGADAERIIFLRPLGGDQAIDVSRRGEIVFAQRRETRSELWRAELR